MQLKVFHLRRSRFAPFLYIIFISGVFATPANTSGTRLIGVTVASLNIFILFFLPEMPGCGHETVDRSPGQGRNVLGGQVPRDGDIK